MNLVILVSLLVTAISSATVLPRTINLIQAHPDTNVTHAVFFPGTAQALDGRQARTQLTNAELLKRGQPLAKPVKLYDAVALAKRVIGAPPQASSVPNGGPQKNYRFVTCADRATYATQGESVVSAASLQQTANECASRSQAAGALSGYPERFFITSGRSNCYTMGGDYNSVPCQSYTFAVYEVIP